ncbi:hypothetical protein AB0M02_37595 [Actinoplanes sp. NPDC051861]|uniref:hypothetical protein n=1 Tax=Actinoplanes sp. NPDC051861 TaxID=3155170 RepID=UPI003442C52A
MLSLMERASLWGSGLGAVVSATALGREPLTATLCMTFFGGCCAFLIYESRRRATDETISAVGGFLRERRLARHDIDGYQQLVEIAAPLRGRAGVWALTELSHDPRLMDGLFFHARRREIAGLPEPGTEPLSWALASLHPNGYVREAAVAAMGRAPRFEFVPFLVERAVERVDAVRSAALAALRQIPAGASAESFARVAARRHAGDLAELWAIPGHEDS